MVLTCHAKNAVLRFRLSGSSGVQNSKRTTPKPPQSVRSGGPKWSSGAKNFSPIILMQRHAGKKCARSGRMANGAAPAPDVPVDAAATSAAGVQADAVVRVAVGAAASSFSSHRMALSDERPQLT